MHVKHHAQDGSQLAVRVSAAAMDTGYVLLCSDQTALRRAEQHFQTVVDSLDKGVVVIAPDGTSSRPIRRRCRFSASAMSGTRPHTLSGCSIPPYGEDDRPLSVDERPVNVAVGSGRDVTNAVVGFDCADGKRIWLSIS